MKTWFYAVDIKDTDYDPLLRHAVKKAAMQGWEFVPQHTRPSAQRGFTTTVFCKSAEECPSCPTLGSDES
jgi:hypothetical protein